MHSSPLVKCVFGIFLLKKSNRTVFGVFGLKWSGIFPDFEPHCQTLVGMKLESLQFSKEVNKAYEIEGYGSEENIKVQWEGFPLIRIDFPKKKKAHHL